MKLADFMHQHSITPQQLRTMLGVKSRSTVRRYLNGERLPSPDLLARIETLSGGLVTRDDFLDPAPPKCVRVVIDRHGQQTRVYPWTELEHRRNANDNRRKPVRNESDDDPWPSPPLRRAMDLLGSRVKLSARGGFLLDGRIADTRRVVKAANALLVARGEKPISYPGVEPIW